MSRPIKLIWLLSGFIFSLMVNANPLLAPLFANKSSQSLKLAPTGEHYVITRTNDKQMEMTLHATADQSIKNKIDLRTVFDENSTIRSILWLDKRHVAAILIEKAEVERTLIERNVQSRIIIVDVMSSGNKPIIYQVSTRGFLVEPAPSEEGVFYFSRSGRFSKVYRIEIAKLLKVGQARSKLTRVDGGQFIAQNVVTEVDGYATEWFFNAQGKPVAVLMYTSEGTMDLAVYSEHEETGEYTATTIKTWQEAQFKDRKSNDSPVYLPIAKAAADNTFYAMDINEEQAVSLYLVDFKNDKVERVYASPGLPIEDIIYGENEQAIGVVVVEQGLYTEHYFDERPSTTELAKNPEELSIVSAESTNGDIQILYKQSHNQAPRYYLKKADATPVLIMQDYPDLPISLPSKQVMNTVKVDGKDIPYLLTLPQNASAQSPVPIILMPHGGPFNIYDSPYFDADSQLFAASGIAVLRVNFRGSGGYGIEHRDAGKKQWGGVMLDDLNAAFEKVIKRDDIDAARTCIVGMSYGGYAALMLTSTKPALYGCGVSVSGVADMNVFLKSPHISERQLAWLHEYAGDPSTDFDELVASSPLYKLPQLRKPLMIIHGAQDEIVNVENAYRAKLVLEKANIPFSFKIIEDANHHFSEEGQTQELYKGILDFVLEHLTPEA